MLAIPVAQASVANDIRQEVDELVCVMTPGDLYAIAVWYDDFPQLSDEDVRSILARAATERTSAVGGASRRGKELDGDVKPPPPKV